MYNLFILKPGFIKRKIFLQVHHYTYLECLQQYRVQLGHPWV